MGMSKSKKVSNNVDDYSELKNQLMTNINGLVFATSELNSLVKSLLKDASSETELASIKQEWIESSNKIDKIDDTIIFLSKEKTEIIKKIESLINKKGKSTPAQSKTLASLKEEWLEVSNQITILNNQLETYNKERAKLIKKTENYFSKLDSKDIKEKKVTKKEVATPKAIVKKETKAGAKDSKKTVSETKAVKKSETPTKVTKATKTTKNKKEEVKEVEEVDESSEEKELAPSQVKLKLDSDSDSETSDSDTDSDLSSIEEDSDDSDSDSDSDSSDDGKEKE